MQRVDVQEAGDGSELWAIRRFLSPAVGRIRPNKINEDIVTPRSRVPDYLEAMEALQAESGLPIVYPSVRRLSSFRSSQPLRPFPPSHSSRSLRSLRQQIRKERNRNSILFITADSLFLTLSHS